MDNIASTEGMPARERDDAADHARDTLKVRSIPRVLLVEDDVEYRETLTMILEDAGYEVVGAANGAEALLTLLLEDGTPDLIVLDLVMPKKSGWQTWAEIESDPALGSVPVVVLTGSGQAEGSLGRAVVVSKNTRAPELLRIIAAQLKR